jgi:uncharacterized Zn finger protein (UPF0148 family)
MSEEHCNTCACPARRVRYQQLFCGAVQCKGVLKVEIEAEDYERLKRLEENVDKKLDELAVIAEHLDVMRDCPDRGFRYAGKLQVIRDKIKLLKSLRG